MKNFALVIAGILFSLVSLMHFIRYTKGWAVTLDNFKVPVDWSLYAGIVIAVIALWMFVAAAVKTP